MASYRITGAAEIALVAAAVRKLGTDRKIVNDMAAAIRRGTSKIRDAIKAHEVLVLPSGLGAYVASGKIKTLVRRAPKSAGVLIRQGRNSQHGTRVDMRRLDAGRIRHLTWGREPWHPQTVTPGAFSEGASEEGTDQLEAAILEACENAAERLANG